MTDWRSGLDQAIAGLKDYAGVLFGYYTELVNQGFTPEQALRIVLGWQRVQMQGSPAGEDE